MTFQFPSQHHNNGWASSPRYPSSSSHDGGHGGMGGINKQQAKTALDYLVAHDLSHPRKADQIQPGLYLGDLLSAKDLTSLETKRITHVLTVCRCPELTYPPSLKIDHKVIGVADARDEDLLDHFKDCWRYVRDALDGGGRVLIHCEQGISRSPTVLAAYLMREERMHPVAAIKYIRKFRPIIDPNPGFREQLDVWGNCRGELAGQADYVEWKRKVDGRAARH